MITIVSCMEVKLMILGTIICAISIFFIHNSAQIYCFLAGALVFIIGAALEYKEISEKIDG